MNLRRLINQFSVYQIKKSGEGFHQQIQLFQNDKPISFWHDVNYQNGDDINIGIEIPFNKIAKLEVSKEIIHNPIIQDTRKNRFTKEKELRYYAQFPCFNYGFIPQTWENSEVNLHDNYKGDDDPLDVCELGSTQLEQGQILKVKVLGSFCVLDQSEIDWKILTLNVEEAEKLKVNTFDDYLKIYPWKQQQILDWFRYIKVFDGKKENPILFDGKIIGVDETRKVIADAHNDWIKLLKSPELESKRKEFHIK